MALTFFEQKEKLVACLGKCLSEQHQGVEDLVVAARAKVQ
eukprot:SAG11_NODE_35101_length_268_cov_0.917160_1_plen_39_part_10